MPAKRKQAKRKEWELLVIHLQEDQMEHKLPVVLQVKKS